MTLEEKAGMCSGYDFWHLKGVERLGVPRVMVCDGPHGLRKQPEEADMLGINNSIPATSFPTAVLSACSFDEKLLKQMAFMFQLLVVLLQIRLFILLDLVKRMIMYIDYNILFLMVQ